MIIGIGGSAGAHRPLSTILSALPADFPASVLVTRHRHATSDSLLSRLLAPSCALQVREAKEDDLITPGVVYVAPPDLHLVLAKGRVRLSAGPRENCSRPSIDVLFRSMAVEAGPRAIGILLSGLSTMVSGD